MPRDGVPPPQPQQLPPNTALPDLLYWGEDHDGLLDGPRKSFVRAQGPEMLSPTRPLPRPPTRHFWGKVGYPAFPSKIVSPPLQNGRFPCLPLLSAGFLSYPFQRTAGSKSYPVQRMPVLRPTPFRRLFTSLRSRRTNSGTSGATLGIVGIRGGRAPVGFGLPPNHRPRPPPHPTASASHAPIG